MLLLEKVQKVMSYFPVLQIITKEISRKGHKFNTDKSPLLTNPERYRRLIGRLLYLNLTRPDMAYVVQQLSQYVHTPHQEHWDASIHTLHYLKNCPFKGLSFPSKNNFKLTAFCDADWASCIDTRRSLTGY